ncbi:MAG: BNR-4 repeat-containing protein [Planctomycetaceae bacterium]|nr:exo-alpha-sialidase [Planctomycetaceae bacterium]MDG2388400.1 BNR-4 repeat-containing protein [Planctomycetaceae bacterium]
MWYAWFEKGQGDTITASYVYHPCNKRGRHTNDRYNTYYMQMNTADATWTNAPGKPLAMPIRKEYADENTMMFDTHGGRVTRGTCRVDENGAPHVFFRHDKGQVRYYRWLGDKWQQPVTVLPGNKRNHDGDMVVHSPTHISLLLSYKNDAGSHVGYFNSTDGGLTWQKALSLLSAKNIAFNDISSIVRNAHPDARLMLSSNAYGQVNEYRNMILLGDKGPVTRPKKQTSNLGNRLELFRQGRAKGK